jgi:hypothetical protein
MRQETTGSQKLPFIALTIQSRQTGFFQSDDYETSGPAQLLLFKCSPKNKEVFSGGLSIH